MSGQRERSLTSPATRGLHPDVPPDEVPPSQDLFSAEDLERHLNGLAEPPYSVLAGGDVMLGGRAKKVIAARGADYPFEAVRPLLRRAAIASANLEAPFARNARRAKRTYSYRVSPRLACSLARAGIGVVTLANNHLLDCGREGALETLDALERAGVAPMGAGVDKVAAHAPVIRQAGRWRVGLLGYYWNRRCAATETLPGSAVGNPESLQADLRALRGRADRIVVNFHWGAPYVREPSPEDRALARFAVDCGADAVIGHHPHVVQPFEVYRARPIFYSVGNLMLGSGNSRAEGMLVGLRFEELRTRVDVFPLYVKNRDPRVDYQPKALRLQSAERLLRRLVEASEACGEALQLDGCRGKLDLPRPANFEGGGEG